MSNYYCNPNPYKNEDICIAIGNHRSKTYFGKTCKRPLSNCQFVSHIDINNVTLKLSDNYFTSLYKMFRKLDSIILP